MPRHVTFLLMCGALFVVTVAALVFQQASPRAQAKPPAAGGAFDSAIAENAQRMIGEGRRIFRYDTFGDEASRRARS